MEPVVEIYIESSIVKSIAQGTKNVSSIYFLVYHVSIV